MTLDLEKFALAFMACQTPEQVEETIAAARADYDADIWAAVETERERCAQIADAEAKEYKVDYDETRDMSSKVAALLAEDIAAAIRNGGAL